MELNVILAFWSVSILFVLTPGADWAYAILAGIEGKFVSTAVTGLILGHLIAILCVAAGVGSLLNHFPILLTAMTVLGAGYLLWMGVHLLLQPATISHTDGQNQSLMNAKAWLIKGVGISGLNPKVLLLFFALLPPFIHPKMALSPTVQIMMLGMIHLLSCAVVYMLVGVAAKKLLRTRPAAVKIVSRISGGLMVLIALILVVGQV
ncbi:LysE family transporter [Acinetobacter haemolyticus]|uniref:LysE family transporter n=1 Tax=Acinetobacter haemolyticus TaxID=29430 RepID=A0AAJ3D8C1_ACIHA|nr:LysE family translocator [Acinetobacter haemolyticus]NAR18085.1 LysE family transporter [Acinetobacter haemolyticus]NAR29328.1 LysE family transporter [Acinetobacter haemolyticus]NAR34925.1 LysE family transporter [Acinetobacter haemolyticus]NAR48173.1 LysE family transporter [Acinetobacter haemolyticus]NAR63440.1 LysE family transporter [Acinetobacter haemolyticus]